MLFSSAKSDFVTLFDDDEIKSESQQVKITDFLSFYNWHSMVPFMGDEQINELWGENELKKTHYKMKLQKIRNAGFVNSLILNEAL